MRCPACIVGWHEHCEQPDQCGCPCRREGLPSPLLIVGRVKLYEPEPEPVPLFDWEEALA